MSRWGNTLSMNGTILAERGTQTVSHPVWRNSDSSAGTGGDVSHSGKCHEAKRRTRFRGTQRTTGRRQAMRRCDGSVGSVIGVTLAGTTISKSERQPPAAFRKHPSTLIRSGPKTIDQRSLSQEDGVSYRRVRFRERENPGSFKTGSRWRPQHAGPYCGTPAVSGDQSVATPDCGVRPLRVRGDFWLTADR